MSPKAKKPASAKEKDHAETSEKKGGKNSKAAAAPAPAAAAPTGEDGVPVDPDEAEEEAAVAAGSGSGGGNAAALAAAAGTTEMSASFKNFRHHPDMENFYRFIYENDLRHEALAIIEDIIVEKAARKAAGGGKGTGGKSAQH